MTLSKFTYPVSMFKKKNKKLCDLLKDVIEIINSENTKEIYFLANKLGHVYICDHVRLLCASSQVCSHSSYIQSKQGLFNVNPYLVK